jgi:F-type H+-transporting ATPase subunit b
MVCFWVTMWLVYRFLIRPVGSVLDDRRQRIDGAQREWTARNEEYTSAIATVEAEVQEAAREAAATRAAARQQAMDHRQAALDEARARADERLTSVLDTLDSEAAEARADLRRRAEGLARLLAGRLLGREMGS